MSNTLNEWRGIGNLGRDPEIRAFSNGDRVANLSLACTDKYKTRDGEQKERTFWAKIRVTGRKIDLIEQYLKKGDRVLFGGRLEERKWQDQSGNDRYSTEIVCDDFGGIMQFLSAPKDEAPAPRSADPRYNAMRPASAGSFSDRWQAPDDLDDAIPF